MRAALAGCVFLLLAGAAHAQTVAVQGQVRNPVTLNLDQLRALPQATVQWSTHTEHGDRTALYEGPLLWDLVKAADPVDLAGDGAFGRSHLQHIILARGSDGYAVAISIGEIDPEFGGRKIVVALPRDGQPTIQLAVPGDGRAGRGVRGLAALEVR